jgi:hypothetical protein
MIQLSAQHWQLKLSIFEVRTLIVTLLVSYRDGENKDGEVGCDFIIIKTYEILYDSAEEFFFLR